MSAALRDALREHPIRFDYDDGVLTMAGEVPDLATKKLALVQAASLPDVRWIADRLRVTPSVRMDDHSLLAHVRDALLDCTAFEECAIVVAHRAHVETAQDPPGGRRGEIRVTIEEAVVTLDGRVPSLVHKRLAGIVCWWVSGTSDVVNALEVVPPEQDSDEEITEAVRVALEKDPLVDASQVGVRTTRSVVTLQGVLASPEQRDIAERDAWYVFGVDRVKNEIAVLPPSVPTGRV